MGYAPVWSGRPKAKVVPVIKSLSAFFVALFNSNSTNALMYI